ncbi:MAG: hypothetical protein Q4G03_08920 [Planctomycetia bacterium]|nr:hypothetical protein [Planctomycetia bacterium]
MPEVTRALILGTDEAGYGPNLGPLVLGASAWTMSLSKEQTERLPPLESFAAPRLTSTSAPAPNKPTPRRRLPAAASQTLSLFELVDAPQTPCDSTIPEAESVNPFDALPDALNERLYEIAQRRAIFPLMDSKRLYLAGKTLHALERSYWLARALIAPDALSKPLAFRAQTQTIDHRRTLGLTQEETLPPWEEQFDCALPLDARVGDLADLQADRDKIHEYLKTRGLNLCALTTRRVQPRQFNALIKRLALKSDLIAEVTLATLAETLICALSRDDVHAPQGVYALALCDKLGGRDHYAQALRERFPQAQLTILREAREQSVYRLLAQRARVRDSSVRDLPSAVALEVRFTAKGERYVPTALASICAKYWREISMHAFNVFWRKQLSDELRPTAGYPVDAIRFRNDVEKTRRRLGISDEEFWRVK